MQPAQRPREPLPTLRTVRRPGGGGGTPGTTHDRRGRELSVARGVPGAGRTWRGDLPAKDRVRCPRLTGCVCETLVFLCTQPAMISKNTASCRLSESRMHSGPPPLVPTVIFDPAAWEREGVGGLLPTMTGRPGVCRGSTAEPGGPRTGGCPHDSLPTWLLVGVHCIVLCACFTCLN